MSDEKSLIPQAQKNFELKPYKLTLTQEVDFSEWEKMGHALRVHRESNPFWIGDWLIIGEGRWGEMYAQAMHVTGLDKNTLSHYKGMAQAIPQDQRRLSMGHYRLLKNLDDKERKKLEEEAVNKDWGLMELREHIVSSKFKEPKEKEAEEIKCEVCGKEAKDFEEWLVCRKCAKIK